MDELLRAERDIGDQLARTDVEGELILAAARENVALRRVAAREQLALELKALESSLRAVVATEVSTLIDSTHASTEAFDHVSDAQVSALAEFVLQRLYDMRPIGTVRAP